MGAAASLGPPKPPVPAAGVMFVGMEAGRASYMMLNPLAGTSTANVKWPNVTLWYVSIAPGYTMSVTGTGASNGQSGVFQGGGPAVIATGTLGLNNINANVGNTNPAPAEHLQSRSSYVPPNVAAARARGYRGAEHYIANDPAAGSRVLGSSTRQLSAASAGVKPRVEYYSGGAAGGGIQMGPQQINPGVRTTRPTYRAEHYVNQPASVRMGPQPVNPTKRSLHPAMMVEQFSVQGAYQGLVHQMHELAPGNMTGDAPTSRGGMM